MQERELQEMYEMETDHWWFVGKRRLVERVLQPYLRSAKMLGGAACALSDGKPNLKILDVGCGTGAAAAAFMKYGSVVATDRSPFALDLARSRGLKNTVVCAADQLPFSDAAFDTLLALDIIEHVDDDAATLADFARVLKPGGTVAIHVPAWPSLWSRHDVAIEHRRRYTRRSLSKLLQNSPLETEHIGWTNMSVLFPAALHRGLQRLSRHREVTQPERQDNFSLPKPLNLFMTGLLDLEGRIAARVGLPIGLSLIAIATKPKSANPMSARLTD